MATVRTLKGTLTMILVHSWESLQTSFPTRANEWYLGLAMTVLGVVFLINPILFLTYPGPLAGLASFADQRTWCVICLGLGMLRLVALTINGLWWRSPSIRCVMAFLSCFVWWQLAWGLIGNIGIASAFLPLCVVFDAWNAIRCGRKAGVSEYVHRLELKAEARHGHSAKSADA